MSVYFVSGAGTDIGKTYVTALLARRLNLAGHTVTPLKPVASGVPALDSPGFAATDTAVLLGAAGREVNAANVGACTPWRFTAPLSPDMAAAAEGRTLPFAPLLAWCREAVASAPASVRVLIEGVGGVMSPVADDALNLDLIEALAAPVIVVGGSYLGSINHTLTALEALRARRAVVHAVVVNESVGSTIGLEATLDTLRRFAQTVPLLTLRRGAETLALDLD